jgi:hypothetical protein
MKYRPLGQAVWREGTTENISRSGVLFRAPDLLDLNTPIEMRVALPVGPSPERFPEVLCRGRIVRTMDVSADEPRPALAAEITDYHLMPAKIDTRKTRES